MGTSLILFILIGLAAGWLAGQIMKGSSFGIVGDIIVGVIGALIGIWIDHRKAIVVAVTDTGEENAVIISKVEKHLRRSGDSPLTSHHESHQIPADDSRQRAFTGHLNIYYDAVIACIREAEAILIFGPGEAKSELQKRLESHNTGERIVGIETVDKMTDRQIAAKVRQYFLRDQE
jgi:uncharacterized membrane protein YeaQ/YmgE (transglycosylase-associated protein family)